MPRSSPVLVLALLPAWLLQATAWSQSPPTPPVAARVTHVDTVAGVEWPDPYAWLRDDQRRKPEVLAYLRAENAYADGDDPPQPPLRAAAVPGDGGSHQGNRPLGARADGRVLLLLADGEGPAVSHLLPQAGQPLGARGGPARRERAGAGPRAIPAWRSGRSAPTAACSPTRQDTTGSEWYTVHVKDLRTGKLLPDAIDSVSYGLEWAADNRTLFFTPRQRRPPARTASSAAPLGDRADRWW